MSAHASTDSTGFVDSFAKLAVYQKARELARTVFEVSRRFPREEAYSLVDQWRRASRSVGAQIAEDWGKRRYLKHFASKLSDADSEQLETQHWIIVAFDAGYITRDEAHEFGSRCKEIGRMLGSMIQKAESFGLESPILREDPELFES
jgi:four helix bundle protein